MEPGYRLEYAKSGRATCSTCGRLIEQDSLRVGVESPSSFHDGFDVNWNHFDCISYMVYSKAQGVEFLRWEDQAQVRALCGEPFPSHLDKAKVKKDLDALWKVKDEVAANLKTKDLVTLVEANGYVVKKKNPASLQHKVADGLLNGMLGACPQCKKNACLAFDGAQYHCRGWQTAYVRCNWKGTGKDKDAKVERFKFKIPSDLKKNNKYLKAFKFAKGYPTKRVGQSGDDDEEEEEEESQDEEKRETKVPKGQELYAIAIMLAGTKTQLGKSAAEIRELIEEHGGEVVDNADDATVCISAQKLVDAKKKSKKIASALKKVPVLTIDWLENITDGSSDVVAMRFDADAIEPYLIGGKLKGPLFYERYDAARIKKREAKEKADAEKFAKEEAERSKKRKRAQPKADSEILRVDPGTGKKGKIYVTYDDKYGYTPYNCALNFTDLQTGVNKFYKMQIVEAGKSFYFWISYGRVGVAHIGDSKIYKYFTHFNENINLNFIFSRQVMEKRNVLKHLKRNLLNLLEINGKIEIDLKKNQGNIIWLNWMMVWMM